jgi:hypothetical protein
MAKPKSADEIRAERIAHLQNPEARAAIDKIEKERQERLTEVRASQRENFDKYVDQLARQKEASRNAPQLTPPGFKPDPVLDKQGKQMVRSEAEADVYRRYKLQDQAENMTFDKKVDRELDAADRRQGREPGHTMQHDTPDRGDR